ncbi:MAG: hypothetical protein K0M64_09210 [Rhizobium sp.]|nr:hypothetical protein [Rhizobium sp.]
MQTTQMTPTARLLACAALLLSSPLALAQSLEFLSVTPSTPEPGMVAAYTVEFRADAGTAAIPAGQVVVRVDFADQILFSTFNYPTTYGTREAPGAGPFPAYTMLNWPGGSFSGPNQVLSANLNAVQANSPGSTWYNFNFVNLINPLVPGTYPVTVELVNTAGNVVVGSANYNLVIGFPDVALDANPPAPRLYAEEIVASPGAPVALTNTDGLDMSSALGYSFSTGEVRYARFECDNGMRFDNDATATYDGAGSVGLGSINGLGGSAIYFSVTANDNAVTATDRLVIDGGRSITSTNDVDCTYSLYDFPSQAQAGGAAGRVATASGPYLQFAPSYALVVDSEGNPVANVESNDPAYSEFVLAGPTFNVQWGEIGGFSYGTVSQVSGSEQPRAPSGLPVTLVDLMDADTTLVFSGNFEAAADVFLSTDADCGNFVQSADGFDDVEAVFTIGANAAMGRFLCYEAGGEPIPVGEYTVALEAVSADPALWNVTDRGPLDLGVITRNGTELQAPLAQVPANYLSRLVLTNTGSQDRPYEVAVFGETGNVISTANLTGSVPAGGTQVVDLTSVLTGFTAAPRATLNVTIAGPNGQIQGLYQIVNPDSGTISNHVMVRPGSN